VRELLGIGAANDRLAGAGAAEVMADGAPSEPNSIMRTSRKSSLSGSTE
jgi:hypothetical protein